MLKVSIRRNIIIAVWAIIRRCGDPKSYLTAPRMQFVSAPNRSQVVFTPEKPLSGKMAPIVDTLQDFEK